MTSIQEWLNSIGLGDYLQRFVDSRIDFDILPDLTDLDLEKLGIPLGDRKRMMRAITALTAAYDESGEQDSAPLTSPDTESPASAASEFDQLRHVNVCFVDLVGSTVLSTELDLEDFNDLIRTYHGTCARVIQEFGGYVAQYAGDGVMAIFGYPRAEEDDPERAVLASLKILDEVAKLGVDRPTSLAARIGIASGQSLIGTLVYVEAETVRSAMGEIPNLAARLQTVAAPGTVVVSEATWRLLGTQFVCKDAGRHELKGFPEAIQVYQVRGVRPTESRFEAHQRGVATPFVNRDEEIGQLRLRWARACAGHGNVALLSGEPGIGKSRLGQHLTELIGREAYLRLQFQCSAHHSGSTLYPISAHMEHAARLTPADLPAERLQKLATLLADSPKDLQNLPIFARLLSLPVQEADEWFAGRTAKEVRQAMIDAPTSRIFRLAEAGPLLVLFEDLHWIDPSSRELLDLVVEQITERRILLVCTFRREFTPRWIGLPQVTMIEVNRLDRAKSAAIAASLLAGQPPLPVPVDAIVDKTDGVPLFIEELTKAAMASSSACDPVGGHAERGQPQGPLALPSTLKASLMSRLDRLPGADQVMPIGAALGRSFSYALLAAVTRLDAGTLVPILARLVDAELLLQRGEPPDAIYSFKHALVQDIAYESQLKSRMRELHARIAATIEASFAEIAENRPELVAQHYAHGGLATRAVPYWERAAEKAVASAANQEAIAHLEAALRDNGQDPDRTARARNEIRLREALCVPLEARSWGSADIANNLARLQELVAEHGDNAQLFTILHGLCGTHLIGGNIEQALNDAGEMLRIADRADDPALNVLSRHALGMSSFFLGAFDQAIEHFEQAIEGRQGVSDDALQKYYVADPQVVGRCMQAWAIALQDKTEATGVRITQGLALVEGAEHDFTKVYGLALLASVSQTRGDAPGAIDLAVRADELSRHGDFTYWQAWAGIVLGWATAMTGSPTSGIQRLEAGLEVYRQTGSQQIVPYGQALLADAYLKGGEIAMAMTAIKEIDAFQRDHSVRFYDRRIDQLRQRLHQDAAIHRQ